MSVVSERVLSISRFKKEKFLKTLSEDEFRDRVVRTLYFRLGFGDGRDLCGPIEKGKDAIFSEQNKLGHTEFIAVQTKKGNLNLSSKVSQNIASAIVQLQTALKTNIPRLSDRKKVFPSQVHLCASGKINEHARHHILETVNDPRIAFLDSDELIPLIDLHFPEIWLDIDSDILPYYRAIVSRVEKGPVTPVEGLDISSDVLTGAATDQSFVSLNLYRTTIEKKKSRGKFIENPKFEEIGVSKAAEHKKKKILILGDAGSGKSTALLRIAYDLARRGSELEEGYKIPILLKAIELSRDHPDSLAEYCDIETRRFASLKKSCFTQRNLENGEIVLLVDALDEIADKRSQENVLSLIDEFSKKYPKVRIILTARPYAFVKDMALLSDFEVFDVSPISWKQATKIVTNLQKRKAVSPEDSRELLRRIEQVHGIELSPLLVTVFAATAEMSRQDIPANITELFKKFTELMLGRWDENKGLDQQYQAPLKDFLLTRLAFEMHRKELTSISIASFRAELRSELEKRGHHAQIETIADELLNRSGLLSIVGDRVEFRHHLLQEFFAGRGIQSEEFLRGKITEDWWKRAIVFYFGEKPDNVAGLKGALESVANSTPKRYFEAATAVGLALQACYLSEVTEKMEVWRSVATAMAIGSISLIDGVSDDTKYPMSLFVGYYLYGRDSVALSNVADNIEDLKVWISDSGIAEREISEARLFWLIVGLVECGELKKAHDLVKDYQPESGLYLLAIHIGCFLAKEVRQLNPDAKKQAGKICGRLERRVDALRVQLVKEFGSQLLEVRKGEVRAIESDGDK